MNTGTKKRSAIIALLALTIGLVIPLTSAPVAQAQMPTREKVKGYFTGIEFIAAKAPILHLPVVITRFLTNSRRALHGKCRKQIVSPMTLCPSGTAKRLAEETTYEREYNV